MSWSINLSGPKAIVLRELEDALGIVGSAIQAVENTEAEPQDSVAAAVSGYVSWDDKGVVTSSTSQSVTVIRYVPPQPSAPEAEAAPQTNQ